jgi:quercetin dioxygenase-like cupin family protein
VKGVVVRKIKIVHEDERRKILEIMNGELSVKNMKMLYVKSGEQLLGNHWHSGSEVMYILRGKAQYVMENLDTGEKEEYQLVEGDVVFRTGRIVHAGIFSEDSIIIDGGESMYISADFNDIPEKIL